MVVITAKVFGNFNFRFKNRIIGLPINDNTAAIIMQIITERVLYRKNKNSAEPRIINTALKIPLLIVFEFISGKYIKLLKC